MRIIDYIFKIDERIEVARKEAYESGLLAGTEKGYAKGSEDVNKSVDNIDFLWTRIIAKEFPAPTGETEAAGIWSSVFMKTPELLDYLRKREITLLKSVTLKDKPEGFVLGQIAENRMWTRFEPKNTVIQKVEIIPPKAIPSQEKFLAGWQGKKDEHANENKKEDVGEGGVQGAKEKPAGDSR